MDLEPVIKEFLAESQEGLQRFDLDLVAFENAPDQLPLVGRMLRVLHTLKGTAGVLGYLKLEALAHNGEALLCAIRDDGLVPSTECINGLLALTDALRSMLALVEAERDEGEETYPQLHRELERLRGAAPSEEPDPSEPQAGDVPPEPRAGDSPSLSDLDLSLIPVDEADDADLSEGGIGERTVRLDVALLDRLMDTVGELVLARNRIQQLASGRRDNHLFVASQRLGVITSDLQEGVMKTRMQPITSLWNRLPRLVRDLAHAFRKKVRLLTSGEDTELDRSMLEAFTHPLTHLVRNCVDHGIEMPDVRVAAGKPAEGTLRLSSFHQGGYVHIEVADDGGGLNVERIAQRAIEAGLLSPEEARSADPGLLHQLIFRPGFSTAREVTSVSGRGVGLDVVKSNVERIGGAIEVKSQPGRGTTFRVRIPLTLAIIPALLVSAEGRYAIPQVSLLELVTVAPGEGGLETVKGSLVYRLRDELLSLVDLREVLGGEPLPLEGRQEVNIVVLQGSVEPFGLIVDEIHDTEEIVVKPLGDLLRGIEVYSGATVLGEGQVALILDVDGLAARGRLHRRGEEGAETSRAAEEGSSLPTETLLLVRSSGEGQLAIPLSSVARLEEFEGSEIERAGAVPMVQYRGTIIPLLYVSHLLEGETRQAQVTNLLPDRETLYAVVYQAEGFSAGIVVDEILDIVEVELEVLGPATREGIVRTAVVQGRVTEVVDATWLLRSGNQILQRSE